MPNLARRVSKPGSLSLEQKRQQAPTSEVAKGAGFPGSGLNDSIQTKGEFMTTTKLILMLVCLMSVQLETKEAKVTPLFSKELTDFPGKEGLMITVEYPPGSSDPIHRHNAHAFVYVLEGSIVMQVRGGKEVTLTPGQTFYEGPSDVHVVGRNASQTKSAKFVVFLVKDKGVPVLVPAT
jgi:quercetin dioxygenase-like cupin family protein